MIASIDTKPLQGTRATSEISADTAPPRPGRERMLTATRLRIIMLAIALLLVTAASMIAMHTLGHSADVLGDETTPGAGTKAASSLSASPHPTTPTAIGTASRKPAEQDAS